MKTILLYPPHQAWKGTMCKPNGSLAYPYLAGALRDAGHTVEIFDACVGNNKDDLNLFFNSPTELENSLYRTGVSDERILEEVMSSGVVGITSIFTDQESMVLHCVRLIKKHYPEIYIISGGVNARSRMQQFFDAGVDAICLSEGEKTIVKLVESFEYKGHSELYSISGIAYMSIFDEIMINPTHQEDIIQDLDELPMPAWDLLPNERYWKIGRPHGGTFKPGTEFRYAAIMTSRGCPYKCTYCHIAKELPYSDAGDISKFRIKSDERVLKELEALKILGVKQIYIEDDSLFAKKQRGIDLLNKIRGDWQILDVNGVNLVHMFKHNKPDMDVINSLINAGFTEITLAFESGVQRVIKKYASNKWQTNKVNTATLFKACNDKGLKIAGNYMLGYPDETREEMEITIEMARRHKLEGMNSVNFFCVIPLPGTPLFDMAIEGGHINRDTYNPNEMTWMKAAMSNLAVSTEELETIRNTAWKEINSKDVTDFKKTMTI